MPGVLREEAHLRERGLLLRPEGEPAQQFGLIIVGHEPLACAGVTTSVQHHLDCCRATSAFLRSCLCEMKGTTAGQRVRFHPSVCVTHAGGAASDGAAVQLAAADVEASVHRGPEAYLPDV